MKAYRYILCVLALCGLTACENFLDITPQGQVERDDLLSTADGVEDAMYGVYASMRNNSLYGQEMSFFTLDVLAQYFYDGSEMNDNLNQLLAYNYKHSAVQTIFETLWTAMYKNISNVNSVLSDGLAAGAESYPGKVFRGEALGLRAFMHFDLVRLFAPAYTRNPDAVGIPYATTFSLDTPDFVSVREVYAHIVADLLEAERLLADEASYAGRSDYMTKRQVHFNIHAVRATLARVYLCMGDHAKAYAYARKVMDDSGLSLLRKEQITGDVAGVVSEQEGIFGIFSSSEFYDNVKRILWERTNGTSLDLRSDFEDYFEVSDQRRSAYVDQREDGNYRFVKLLDTYKLNAISRQDERISGLNLIRLPEMYYIAAESLLRGEQHDRSGAAALLAQVRQSRGCTEPIDETTDETVMEAIFADSYRELMGEGQTFFAMKRLNRDIRSVRGLTVTASDDIYVVPVPDIEYEYRN